MRIATWNVNSLKARMPRVEEWLSEIGPDVVCLQETKLSDAAFPAMSFQALGYESVHHGQGQWNGVAILSKVGLTDPVFGFVPSLAEPSENIDDYQIGVLNEARLVTARCGGVLVSSVASWLFDESGSRQWPSGSRKPCAARRLARSLNLPAERRSAALP